MEMTDKEKLIYEFYNIVERIDENSFMHIDFDIYMQEICKLFKKYGICKNKEGKEDE
jgi:hypothetical protein